MFHAWSGPLVSGLTFERLPLSRKDEAMVVIGWADHSGSNPHLFDGPGGKLAECMINPSSASAAADKEGGGDGAGGGKRGPIVCILLDSAERWALHGLGWKDRRKTDVFAGGPQTFYIAPVLLHEIGHAIGLVHATSAPEDAMAPYYVPNRVRLSPRDASRARRCYNVGEEASSGLANSYLARHKATLEAAMAAAVSAAVSARAERPLRHVAELLLAADAANQEQQQQAQGQNPVNMS